MRTTLGPGLACCALASLALSWAFRIPPPANGGPVRARGPGPRQRPPTRLHGSTIAPPKAPTKTRRTGGGDGDGLRLLTPPECRRALDAYRAGAKKYCRSPADQQEHQDMIERMATWAESLEVKKVGVKRMAVGNFRSGRLHCMAACEIVWRGFPNHDVRMFVRTLDSNPMYNKKVVGFEMVEALKTLSRENALLLDLSPLREVPCLRVFCFAGMKTLDRDPEFEDPLVKQYKSKVRRSCYILDDVHADIGPYWYEGQLPEGLTFFFRKRFKTENEFEVAFDRPNAGNATGSGTVGGARVIAMRELDTCTDVRERGMVLSIQEQLARRLSNEAHEGMPSE